MSISVCTVLCDAARNYHSLPEYTPLSTMMCDTPRIHLSLPEYTPLFNKIICATLPESTLPSQNTPPFQKQYYMRPSQNLPLHPRIYPLFRQLYVILSESTPPSRNIPPFQQQYVILSESTPPSQNKPPFSTNILLCDALRTYPSLP